jgi:hypothetical protein
MSNPSQSGAEPTLVPAFAERHYSLLEIAKMWNLDIKPVRRMFEGEPEVVVLDSSTEGKMSRRKHKIVRVPEHVVLRVYARMSKAG